MKNDSIVQCATLTGDFSTQTFSTRRRRRRKSMPRRMMTRRRSRRVSVWSFRSVFGFCASGIVVNTDKKQQLWFLLPVEGPPSRGCRCRCRSCCRRPGNGLFADERGFVRERGAEMPRLICSCLPQTAFWGKRRTRGRTTRRTRREEDDQKDEGEDDQRSCRCNHLQNAYTVDDVDSDFSLL